MLIHFAQSNLGYRQRQKQRKRQTLHDKIYDWPQWVGCCWTRIKWRMRDAFSLCAGCNMWSLF